jgi:hypothetical protein
MQFPNIFTPQESATMQKRIESLTPSTTAKWGKMNVAQMLAHCNVTYEMIYETKHPKPNFAIRTILKLLVKPIVVGKAPYKQSSQTAPAFLITDERVFETEKKRLLDHLSKTQQMGEDHFEGKESLSFGKLNKDQWNSMFWKHLDHHLRQFGV